MSQRDPTSQLDLDDIGPAPVSRGDYDVGFGKPPAASRFQKGQSGNPKGRPRGAKNRVDRQIVRNLTQFISDKLDETITGSNGPDRKTYLEAVAQITRIKGAKGSAAHTRLLFELLDRRDRAEEAQRRELRDLVAAYVSNANGSVNERRARRLPEDDVIPHPEDWYFDMESQIPRLIGPCDLSSKSA